jgi:glycosyltransferase involved in cell wall biosynthesis
MRVLYINPFSQQVSGADESLLSLLGGLIPLGVEAHLVLPAPGPQVARYQRLGVTVHFAPLSIIRRRQAPAELAMYAPRLARGSLAVAAIARHVCADLVHTNMEVVLDGALAARLLRLPHVLHYRGNTLDRPRAVFDALTLAWTTLSNKVLCISDATAGIFRRRGRGAKVEVLYDPVDVEGFAAARREPAVRESLGAPDGNLLIGTVGRVHPRKDLATFIGACAEVSRHLPKARFAIVGPAEGRVEGEYQRSLEALARTLGIGERLRFTGGRQDMPSVLKALDIFVLSSRHEGFGRVVAEAMSAGTPVIVSREGALIELVQDGRAGLLATPGDAREFADRILSLADDSGARDRLVRAGVERAASFGARLSFERVLAVYQELRGVLSPDGPDIRRC